MQAKEDSSPIYKHLNAAQKQAVQTLEGSLLILAGAGAGKTRVIVHRIVALMAEKGVDINNILACTFTNKAAREMQTRTSQLLKEISNMHVSYTPWIGTFHSVCSKILRDNLHLMPKRTSFVIYDSKDQLQLVKNVMKTLNINDKIHPPKNFKNQINLCKRNAIEPHEVFKISHLSYDPKFEEVYLAYEEALLQASAFDFESLLLETYKLMQANPQFLQELREKFKYIFVDEYQDTNHIQYLLIKTLAEEHQNICVVGDEDQSIYGWRGAELSNIMNFEKDFPKTKTLFLEQNYRSTENIVGAATALISHNTVRKGKKLFTKNPYGDKILVKEVFNQIDEGRFISYAISDFCQNQGGSWQDFAVLYRTNAQSRAIEDELRSLRIPYKIIGGLRFYERAEIKDIISYLRLILNENDDISFLRVINSPKRGLGKASIEKIQKLAQSKKTSLYQACGMLLEKQAFKGKAHKQLKNFHQMLETLRKSKETLSLYDLYFDLLEASTYIEALKLDNSIEAQSRIENLQEFANLIDQKMKQSETPLTLEEFLEEMSLLSEDDKTKDSKESVTLMTLHNSKGLEFHSVFISGMEEGLFPSYQSLEEDNIEEERRLAYVGMTRAQKRLFLSYVRKRQVWGKEKENRPSCFLEEIPEEFIQHYKLPFFKKKLSF